MSWIKPVTYETASPEVKAFLDEKGHEILNSSRKRPYQMQNLVVYETIEAGAGKMDDEVQRVVGKRYGDLLEYTISNEKHSQICTAYYKQCLLDQGINPDAPKYDEKDQAVVDFSKAVANDNGNIPEEVRAALLRNFTEEQIAVLAGMAVAASGDTLFERIFDLK